MASNNWYSEKRNSEYMAEWEEDERDLGTQPEQHRDYRDDGRQPTSLRGSRSSQPAPRSIVQTPGYNRFGNDSLIEYSTLQPHYTYYGDPTQYTAEPGSAHRVSERNYRPDLPSDGYHPHRISRGLRPRTRTSAERGVDVQINPVSQMGLQDRDRMRQSPIRQEPYPRSRGSREYLDASPLDVGVSRRTQDGQPRRGMNDYDSPWQHEGRPFRALPGQPSSMQEPHNYSSSNSPFQRRSLRQYRGEDEDEEEINDISSHWHESTPPTHPRRPILAREDLRRYDSDPAGRNPFSRVTARISSMNEPPPPTANSGAPLSRDSPAIRVVDRDGYHMEVSSLHDTGNQLGHLVSKSAINDLNLWGEVNRNIIRAGTTLAGRLKTLGSIDLDYYVGDNRNCLTDTFHVFDDYYYKDHDILFSPGAEDNHPVGMVAFNKYGETEDERAIERERERRREEERIREAERLRIMQQQREEQERRNEARRRREREQARRLRED